MKWEKKERLFKIYTIFFSIILFLLLIIPNVLNSTITAKQNEFMKDGKEIKKYLESQYNQCLRKEKYDKNIFDENCFLIENNDKLIIKNSGHNIEDIEKIIIIKETKKMRIVPKDDGKYIGTTYIEYNLNIFN